MEPSYRKRPSRRASIAATVVATVLALAVGLLAGAFAAQAAPKEQLAWASLLFIPLLLLLEILLEVAGGALQLDRKNTRMPVAVALVGGFHLAWLAVRPWQ